jgi:pimeloyl-[acyl-carrier protein] methyl ester esterase
MRFVFVHGWGFDAGVWEGVAAHLAGHELSFVDLGFLGANAEVGQSWPEGAIAVGHSLGTLWLLRATEEGGAPPLRALVSIQGFDRFCPYVPRARVASMRRELRRDAASTLQNFWDACGSEPFSDPVSLNTERLDEGLTWLMEWDARTAKERLAYPILALAARDDRIVPQPMSEAIWGGGEMRWSEGGGHVLPLTRPDWCARHVRDYARDLKP